MHKFEREEALVMGLPALLLASLIGSFAWADAERQLAPQAERRDLSQGRGRVLERGSEWRLPPSWVRLVVDLTQGGRLELLPGEGPVASLQLRHLGRGASRAQAQARLSTLRGGLWILKPGVAVLRLEGDQGLGREAWPYLQESVATLRVPEKLPLEVLVEKSFMVPAWRVAHRPPALPSGHPLKAWMGAAMAWRWRREGHPNPRVELDAHTGLIEDPHGLLQALPEDGGTADGVGSPWPPSRIWAED